MYMYMTYTYLLTRMSAYVTCTYDHIYMCVNMHMKEVETLVTTSAESL